MDKIFTLPDKWERTKIDYFVFHVIVKRKAAWRLAHVLELDVLTQAPVGGEELFDNIFDLITLHFDYAQEHKNHEYLYKSAPAMFWKKYIESESEIVVINEKKRKVFNEFYVSLHIKFLD